MRRVNHALLAILDVNLGMTNFENQSTQTPNAGRKVKNTKLRTPLNFECVWPFRVCPGFASKQGGNLAALDTRVQVDGVNQLQEFLHETQQVPTRQSKPGLPLDLPDTEQFSRKADKQQIGAGSGLLKVSTNLCAGCLAPSRSTFRMSRPMLQLTTASAVMAVSQSSWRVA